MGDELLERQLERSRQQVKQLELLIENQVREVFEAKEALDQKNAYNLAILGGMGNGLFVISPDGQIQRTNPAASRLLGLTPEQLLEANLKDFLLDLDLESLEVGIEAGGDQDPFRVEANIQGPDEQVIPALIQGSLMNWGEDSSKRYIVVVQDQTTQKQLERQLLQSQKLEAIGHLAAGISHEINTPIQYIGDNTQFFQDAVGDLQDYLEGLQEIVEACASPEQLKKIEKLREDCDLDFLMEEMEPAISQTLEGVSQVTRIVKSMKSFSHPGEKGLSPGDLNEAIESTLDVSRNEWKYSANIEKKLDPSLPSVPLNLSEIKQVILNLIVNAAHAIAESRKDKGGQGNILISTSVNDEQFVLLEVLDDGIGIPKENLEKVFNPYFTTKKVGKGTGLGLALTSDVVQGTHRGKIEVSSQPGETRFKIYLPLTKQEAS